MMMADGGFGPAYACQLGRAIEGQIVVDVAVDDTGLDRGLLLPLLERLKEHCDRYPRRDIVIERFNKNDDTEWAGRQGVLACGPAVKNNHNTDPFQPGPDDGWGRRARLAPAHAKLARQGRLQAPRHRRAHTRLRQRGLRQLTVLCSKGQTLAALVRPGKQQTGRTSHRIRQQMTSKSPTLATVTLAEGARRGSCSNTKNDYLRNLRPKQCIHLQA